MQTLNQVQTHYTTNDAKMPTGLKTAQKISDVIGISMDRLNELTESHYIPHWRIDGGAPLYQISEVKSWVANNLIERVQGKKLPIDLRIMITPSPAMDAPEKIREIPNLKSIPIGEYPPGIYFLVHGENILYVGQSVNPLSRIPQHKDKPFSRAYMIPVPSSALNSVEGALIRTLNPPLNCGEKKIAHGPGDKNSDAFFISKYTPCLLSLIDQELL